MVRLPERTACSSRLAITTTQSLVNAIFSPVAAAPDKAQNRIEAHKQTMYQAPELAVRLKHTANRAAEMATFKLFRAKTAWTPKSRGLNKAKKSDTKMTIVSV